jgi:hypothetical protein
MRSRTFPPPSRRGGSRPDRGNVAGRRRTVDDDGDRSADPPASPVELPRRWRRTVDDDGDRSADPPASPFELPRRRRTVDDGDGSADPPASPFELPRRPPTRQVGSDGAAAGVVVPRERYRVGDAMRRESHSIPPPSCGGDFAPLLSGGMPLGSPLFVKRTSGAWTCATLAGRRRDGGCLLVSLDPDRDDRKIVGRGCWWSCLRFVNDAEVVVDACPPPPDDDDDDDDDDGGAPPRIAPSRVMTTMSDAAGAEGLRSMTHSYRPKRRKNATPPSAVTLRQDDDASGPSRQRSDGSASFIAAYDDRDASNACYHLPRTAAAAYVDDDDDNPSSESPYASNACSYYAGGISAPEIETKRLLLWNSLFTSSELGMAPEKYGNLGGITSSYSSRHCIDGSNVNMKRAVSCHSLDGYVKSGAVASEAFFLAAVATISRTSPHSATGSNSVHSATSSYCKRRSSAPDLGTIKQDRISSVSYRRSNDSRNVVKSQHASSKSLDELVKDKAVADTLKSCFLSTATIATGKVDAPPSAVPSTLPKFYRKNSAPELRTIQRDALGAAATTSCAQCSFGSSMSSIYSPVSVSVNLNARTFVGSRRDRFRPRTQYRNPLPGLLGLSSLGVRVDGGVGSSSLKVVASAPCLLSPGQSGGGIIRSSESLADASGGLVWESLFIEEDLRTAH